MPLLKSIIFLIAVLCVAEGNCDELDSNKVIANIVLIGNNKTKDFIITNEIPFKQGDTISNSQIADLLEKAKNNIVNTALFNFVDVTIDTTNVPFAEVTVQVIERWYIWPLPILEIADPNFNTWWQTKDFSRLNYGMTILHTNFRGRKEQLGFITQFGYSKRFGAIYTIPNFRERKRLGINISYSYTQNDEVVYGSVQNKRELFKSFKGDFEQSHYAKLNFTFRQTLNNRHDFELRFNDAFVGDTIVKLSPDYFTHLATSSTYFGMVYSFTHDTRDDASYPLTGTACGITLVKYGMGLKMDNNLNVFYGILNYHGHKTLSNRWAAAMSLRGKWTPTKDIPYYLQEGFGYSNYVRGFELYVIDGQDYLLGKANLKYTIVKTQHEDITLTKLTQFNKIHYALYANLFTDMGKVWNVNNILENGLNNEVISGIGFGLDFVTYYDKVVRLEYSFNSLGESGFFLHFTKSI